MTTSLSKSASDLLKEYVALGLQQSEAADVVDTPRYNRLAVEISEIAAMLKTLAGDQRQLLEILFQHPNLQVRFNSAMHLMPIMPKEARLQIEAIAASQNFPVAGTAGTYLIMVDRQFSDR